MADPVKKAGFGDARLAQKILDDYVDGYEALSVKECSAHGLSDSMRCGFLESALSKRCPEIIEALGFSREFANHITGPAGASAFKKRISWIADNVTVRRHWLFFKVDDYKRTRLMEELKGYGTAAVAARDAVARVVRESVDNNDSFLGYYALSALEAIGPAKADAPLLSRLIEKEQSTLGSNGCSAVKMLGRLEPVAGKSALLHALEVHHDSCREDLALALGRLEKGIVPDLVGIIANEKTDYKSDNGRETAIAALSKLGPESHNEIRKYADQLTVPLVAQLLDAYLVERTKTGPIARLLKIIGKPALPALMATFNHPLWKDVGDSYAGYEVILGRRKFFTHSLYAFEEICHDILSSMPEASLQAMIDLVNGDNEERRRMAYEVLEKMGEDAAGALPALMARLESDPINSPHLSRVLTAVGAPAVRPLREKLYSGNNQVKRHALDALGRIGKKANSALPDCVPFLKDPDAELRRMATIALGDISTGEPYVIMNLAHALSDPDQGVRAMAAFALKTITPGSHLEQIVIPALEHMRDNPQESADNRKTAEEAIQEILKKIS